MATNQQWRSATRNIRRRLVLHKVEPQMVRQIIVPLSEL